MLGIIEWWVGYRIFSLWLVFIERWVFWKVNFVVLVVEVYLSLVIFFICVFWLLGMGLFLVVCVFRILSLLGIDVFMFVWYFIKELLLLLILDLNLMMLYIREDFFCFVLCWFGGVVVVIMFVINEFWCFDFCLLKDFLGGVLFFFIVFCMDFVFIIFFWVRDCSKLLCRFVW